MAQCFLGKPLGRSPFSSGVKSGTFGFECEYQTEFIATCFAKEYIYKLFFYGLQVYLITQGLNPSYSGSISPFFDSKGTVRQKKSKFHAFLAGFYRG